MWRVYRRTGNDASYKNYKDALNQQKLEIQTETMKIKLSGNIKYDSKSFYAYVRSKQKVQNKVGPLEDSAGNIVSDGLLMAENLNQFFSVHCLLWKKSVLCQYQKQSSRRRKQMIT